MSLMAWLLKYHALLFWMGRGLPQAPTAIDQHGTPRHACQTRRHVHVVKPSRIGSKRLDGLWVN
jgi:hypothetical protein